MPARSTSRALPRRYVNAFWEGSRLILLRRDQDGRLVKEERRAEHAAFLRTSQVSEALERQLRESRHIAGVRPEGDWLRVRFKTRELARAACMSGGALERAGVVAFEGDVDPVRRWLTDEDVEIAQPRRVYLDIEIDSRVNMARKEHARILCWSLCDHETGELVQGVLEDDSDEAERILLEDLWDELMSWDQIVAWNGDRFDFPMLLARSRRMRIQVEPRRWLWLDHMVTYQKMNMSASKSGDEKQSMALDRICMSVLKRGKLPFDWRRTFEFWADPELRPQLARYNVEDVVLMRELELATGYLAVHQLVCETTFTFPDTRATRPMRFVEGLMLRLARTHGQRLPSAFQGKGSADSDDEEDDPFKGAYVMEPTRTGILRDVHVCDFATLYPSIILSWNMSPETFQPGVRLREDPAGMPTYLRHAQPRERPLPPGHSVEPLTGAVFRTDVRGLLCLALEQMLALREQWKREKKKHPPGTKAWNDADRMSAAYKIVANSFYGVIGLFWSRLHVREVAEAVTQAGAFLIKETMRAAEERGFRAIYGDTDSIFVTDCTRQQFAGFVDWCNAELYPRLMAEHGARENRIRLAYEKAFEVLLMVRKKRYAGRYSHYEGKDADETSEPEVKGLEYKRGDSLRLTRQMQAEVIDLILGGGIVRPKRVPDCVTESGPLLELVQRWRSRILNDQLERDDVVLSQKLSKPLKEYRRKKKNDGSDAALPAHVEVALKMQADGDAVYEGMRIEYVVTDGGRSPMQRVRADRWDGTYDRFYIWENQVFPPTQRVLEAAFPGERWRDHLRARPTKAELKRQAMSEQQGELFN